MNDDELDLRLRRAFSGIDTRAGFERRVVARIAALGASVPMPAAEAASLSARIERDRANTARRLAREAWVNAVTALGVGAAGVAAVWRHGPVVARWTEDALVAASQPPGLLALALAVLSASLWPVLKERLPR
jgi:ferric-dicitrate binding protein FerR (iron transport regulator)